MKTNYSRPHKSSMELNMTSMIDVIFLLLIFFIFTANFEPLEKLLPTNLNLAGSVENADSELKQEELSADEILIKIVFRDKNLCWIVNQRECFHFSEIRTILRELTQIDSNIPVIIDPQGNIAMENVLDVYDVCRQNGLANIQFAASPESLSRRK